MRRTSRFAHLTLIVLAMGLLITPAYAANGRAAEKQEEQDISQAVVQSFTVDGDIQIGMIVKVEGQDKTSLQPADQKSGDSLLGVTIAPNDAPVTITQEDANKQQVFVATSGRYAVLVTNQNGAINAGDYITVSALAGLGMKADMVQPLIIGTATTAFNGTSNVVGSVKLKDSAGATRNVAIGRVDVTLGVANNPLKTDPKRDNVPEFLTKAAAGIANKPVSTARIYLGVVTLLVTSAVAAVVLYSGVRSGMIAVGRNPLSKKSIIKSLVQTVMAGLTIFIVGILAVYLLLKL